MKQFAVWSSRFRHHLDIHNLWLCFSLQFDISNNFKWWSLFDTFMWIQKLSTALKNKIAALFVAYQRGERNSSVNTRSLDCKERQGDQWMILCTITTSQSSCRSRSASTVHEQCNQCRCMNTLDDAARFSLWCFLIFETSWSSVDCELFRISHDF